MYRNFSATRVLINSSMSLCVKTWLTSTSFPGSSQGRTREDPENKVKLTFHLPSCGIFCDVSKAKYNKRKQNYNIHLSICYLMELPNYVCPETTISALNRREQIPSKIIPYMVNFPT